MGTEIFVTGIRLKKSHIELILQTSAKISPQEINFTYRNITSPLSYPFTFSVSHQKGTRIRACITTGNLSFPAGDWDITINTGTSKAPEFCFPVLGKTLRARLIFGNYSHRVGSNMIFFPMGSTGYRFIFRCRPSQISDSHAFRLKELAAFGLYKLFRPLWKKKKIWLVFEKYCTSAQDNGFYFFRYCMENLPAQEKKHIYFILDKNSAQWPIIRQYQKQVIPFLSFRHIFYLLIADLYIGSDARAHAYAWMPMPNLISREINKHDIFFLQHGVTALKRVDQIFGKHGSSPMTYFDVTSLMEQKIIVENFGYDKAHTPVLGFSRWDALQNKSSSFFPKVLVMPTWRSWLEGKDDDFFCSSQYYRTYMNLLQNQELLSFLKETGTKLIFYIHPKLREFMKTFHTNSSEIELIPFGKRALNELIMECSMLVTDYSSVCWDVYYLGKPVIFYQFDTELYERTNGSYIDMEHDLFGDCCKEENQLVSLIIEYSKNNFHEKEIYGNMRKDLFAYQDHNNCKRIYNFIAEKYGK